MEISVYKYDFIHDSQGTKPYPENRASVLHSDQIGASESSGILDYNPALVVPCTDFRHY